MIIEGASSTGAMALNVTGKLLVHGSAAAINTLYAMVVAEAAYTPASAEQFCLDVAIVDS